MRWSAVLVWAREQAGLACVLALVALAMMSGALRPLDDALASLRFAMVQRPASEQLSVVEIDVPSLRAAGRWPWGRDRFAVAIANLQAAGARSIGFDVDFSAYSSPAADQALANAIARQPGTVLLPTFVQPVAPGIEAPRLVETAPLRALSSEALLASVNVPVDDDGRVRRYQFGFGGGDAYRQSMAGALAQAPHGRTGSFLIDYGVQLNRLGRLSFQDVYSNRFDPALVRGRDILIGATALELGDEFATRRAGVLPGVFVHALAYESLVAGRALAAPHPALVFALACVLALLLRPSAAADLRTLLRRHVVALAAIVGLPVLLQALAPVSAPPAAFALTQALCAIWAMRAELRRRAEAIVREREAGLLHQAMHEPETGLPNRRALLMDIGAELAGQAPGALAVITVGIDRYAVMRGAVGYGVSHALVRAVAARLADASGGTDIAHLSTSVLGLHVSRHDHDALAALVVELEALDPSYSVEGYSIDAFLRLGVAYAAPGDDADSLLEHATLALDEARRLNRPRVTFDPAAYADPSLNLALMSEMERGLTAGHLSLHYQPKVTVADGAIHGVEALVRWRHPERGAIPPDAFIGVAEETGAIRRLTEWTVAEALRDSARLREAGRDVLISVNISGRLLADRAFCDQALAMIGERGGELCFEITETAVIENPQAAVAALAGFHAAGVKVSIDDYGVGLSSLSYLKMLDADELKVDRSLIVEVVESQRDRLILRSTIELAHSLGMVVVAEGVETAEVQAALAGLGCDAVQGYLVSRPLPLPELESFLAAWRPGSRPGRASAVPLDSDDVCQLDQAPVDLAARPERAARGA